VSVGQPAWPSAWSWPRTTDLAKPFGADGFIDLLGVTAAGNMALFTNNFNRDGGRPYSDVRQIGTGWSDYPGLL